MTIEVNEGQLFWDAQDPKNSGWWFRYRDEDGNEQGWEVEAAKDASIETIAAALLESMPGEDFEDAEVKVFDAHGFLRAYICIGRLDGRGIVAGWRGL